MDCSVREQMMESRERRPEVRRITHGCRDSRRMYLAHEVIRMRSHIYTDSTECGSEILDLCTKFHFNKIDELLELLFKLSCLSSVIIYREGGADETQVSY